MRPSPVFSTLIDDLKINVFRSNEEMGLEASLAAADIIGAAIDKRGEANIILASGNSQLTFLRALLDRSLDWSRINVFHMDEYIGLPSEHPATFQSFLTTHLVRKIKPRRFFKIETAGGEPQTVSDGYTKLLKDFPADLCALGIGENGHIAFNDPPYVDFNDPFLVKVVTLDERSRLQQVSEGHFPNLAAVPTQAITLTIPALLSAQKMLCIVPEGRKAKAVNSALLGSIQPGCPASILRRASHCQLYLDLDSASEVIHVIKPGT